MFEFIAFVIVLFVTPIYFWDRRTLDMIKDERAWIYRTVHDWPNRNEMTNKIFFLERKHYIRRFFCMDPWVIYPIEIQEARKNDR